MTVIKEWLVAYAAPAVFTAVTIKCSTYVRKRPCLASVIIHGALVYSIIANYMAMERNGFSFPWGNSALWTPLFILAIMLSRSWIGNFAVLYGMSVLLQQGAMLSTALVLLSEFPVWIVTLSIVPLFVICHELQADGRMTTVLLLSGCGVVAIVLFSLGVNFIMLTTIHLIVGSFLIAQTMFYRVVTTD